MSAEGVDFDCAIHPQTGSLASITPCSGQHRAEHCPPGSMQKYARCGGSNTSYNKPGEADRPSHSSLLGEQEGRSLAMKFPPFDLASCKF